MKLDTYTLHKHIRRRFKRNRVMVGGIDQQWQMDLADMQSMQKFNDGYRCLLICIDVFSKYAWVIPLKKKTGPSLDEAFEFILGSGRKPEIVMTDQGTEFFNRHFKALMKDEDIELYNTYNETKASIVERLIHTLKTKMWRYFPAKKTMRYMPPISTIYLYRDLVESQIVGDVNGKLLKTVPVEGTFGDTITKTFINTQYVPIQTKSFENVEILLRTDTGKPVPFERGNVVVTLHFRQRSYFT